MIVDRPTVITIVHHWHIMAVADQVGLSVKQVVAILDDIEDPVYYAEHAANLDAEHYGNI